MASLFFLLSLLCGFAFFVGMIKPSIVVRWSSEPTRKQVALFFLLPSFILFMLFGQTHKDALEKALEDPLNATNLSLKNRNLDELPSEVLELKNLNELDLSGNNFKTIPGEIRNFKNLEILNLSKNPVEIIPEWLFEMEKLYSVKLDGSLIKSLSQNDSNKDLTFSYKNTPLWDSENQVVEEVKASNGVKEKPTTEEVEENSTDDRTEGFGEFALRSILGQDYGYKRKFGKGEIFYDDPVTQEETDKVGEVMQLMGLFNNEKGVSMLLDKDYDDDDSALYILKMVITDVDDLDAQTTEGFEALRGLVAESALDGQLLHLHLTDNDFDTQKILKP